VKSLDREQLERVKGRGEEKGKKKREKENLEKRPCRRAFAEPEEGYDYEEDWVRVLLWLHGAEGNQEGGNGGGTQRAVRDGGGVGDPASVQRRIFFVGGGGRRIRTLTRVLRGELKRRGELRKEGPVYNSKKG